MIDFHSHILPGMDDGAASPEESIQMLKMSAQQGVDTIFATCHFYADKEDPAHFLKRRKTAFENLRSYYWSIGDVNFNIPVIYPGAEVYYFPGIAACEEIIPLALGNTGLIMVEPPMMPFTRRILDEIEAIGTNLNLIPVVAHLDRYCRLLRDDSLFELLSERRILIQVNASFFLNRDSEEFALKLLEKEMFQLLGSDCHNTTSRAPNLGLAAEKINTRNLNNSLAKLNELSYNILTLR